MSFWQVDVTKGEGDELTKTLPSEPAEISSGWVFYLSLYHKKKIIYS